MRYEHDCYQALRRQCLARGQEAFLDKLQAAADAGRTTDDILRGCGLKAALEARGLAAAVVRRLLEEQAAALDYLRRERPRARDYDGPLALPGRDI